MKTKVVGRPKANTSATIAKDNGIQWGISSCHCFIPPKPKPNIIKVIAHPVDRKANPPSSTRCRFLTVSANFSSSRVDFENVECSPCALEFLLMVLVKKSDGLRCSEENGVENHNGMVVSPTLLERAIGCVLEGKVGELRSAATAAGE